MPSPRPVRKPSPAPDRRTLSYQLREIVASRGLSAYAVAKAAGIDPGVLSRFLSGTRDIRMETADRIAAALGLRLVEVGKGPGRARTPRPAQGQGQGQGQGQEPEADGQEPEGPAIPRGARGA